MVFVQQLSQVANWAVLKPSSPGYNRAEFSLWLSCYSIFVVQFEPVGVFFMFGCFLTKIEAEDFPSVSQAIKLYSCQGRAVGFITLTQYNV